MFTMTVTLWISAVVLAQAERPATGGAMPVATACAVDADCVVTAFAGCCGSCCAPEPHALTKAELERRQRRCAAVDCEAPNCDAVRCKQGEPVSSFRAECRGGACVAVRSDEKPRRPPPPPRAECRVSSDCTIIYPPAPANAACRSSPCGCCPSTNPVAVSVEDRRVRPEPRPVPLKKGEEPVTYGLTPGTTGRQATPQQPRPPPPPACSPCPAPVPARAECLEGRCAIAPHALPE